MSLRKEQIIEVLKEVIYFPKANNIVDSGMVGAIEIENNRITIELFFEDPKNKHADIVENSCKKTIEKYYGDFHPEIIIHRKTKSLNLTENIKHIIAIASGKGGVGKSTIAVNLAVALSKLGFRTGILDADIYGPSIPIMFDLLDERPLAEKRGASDVILPAEKYGLKIMSIGFFIEPSQALIWRGPMASNALNQLFRSTDWGELDFLVVDMPPGTGDIHLTLVQDMPVTGVAIVSTPQHVAVADARKAYNMFSSEKIKVPVLGLIENMSWFTPLELPEKKYYLFGKEGTRHLAMELGLELLGEIPIVESIRESSDQGIPIALSENSHPVVHAFELLAKNIVLQVEKNTGKKLLPL